MDNNKGFFTVSVDTLNDMPLELFHSRAWDIRHISKKEESTVYTLKVVLDKKHQDYEKVLALFVADWLS